MLVDGRNLVWQRLHVGGMHRHHRIEQVSQTDALGLDTKLEVLRIGRKGPPSLRVSQLKLSLAGPIQHALMNIALAVLECNFARGVAQQPRLYQPHRPTGVQAGNQHVLFQVFESNQRSPPFRCS
jgi:hypothetical protein